MQILMTVLMWIVGQFSSIFVGMFNAFLLYSIRLLTLRLAVVGAWVALVAAGIIVLLSFFNSLFDNLIGQLPGVEIVAMFAPSNLGYCITIVFSAHVVQASYILAARIAAYKATIFTA